MRLVFIAAFRCESVRTERQGTGCEYRQAGKLTRPDRFACYKSETLGFEAVRERTVGRSLEKPSPLVRMGGFG